MEGLKVVSVEELLSRAGIAGVAVAPGQKLTVFRGDKVRMHCGWNYRGPAISVTLYCAIGKRMLGVFDEIAVGQKTVSLAQSTDFLAYTNYADIDTSPIAPGVDYDIEAKIAEYMSQTLVKIDNVIDVTGAAEFQGFAITGYEKV